MRSLCLALWITAIAVHGVSGEFIVTDLVARGAGTLGNELDNVPDGSVVRFYVGGGIDRGPMEGFYITSKYLPTDRRLYIG